MKEQLAQIVASFAVPCTADEFEPAGSGLIHETWRCECACDEGRRAYILQRINARVFPRTDDVLENVETVTVHLRERLLREGVADPSSESLSLVRAHTGALSVRDREGGRWRMFPFITDSAVFDTVQGQEHAREVGRALGRFQALVADLDPARLHDTLPGLHDTPRHLELLFDAARRDDADRAGEAGADLAFVRSRSGYAPLLMNALRSGKVPFRVVHNDPKVNNVLVHRRTGKAICMIDLDTVKPGTVAFDLGDCVRSAANTAGEEVASPDEVVFDRTVYEAIREGYLGETAPFLTEEERRLLPVGVKVITFELGVRFLADHLRGDDYFRIRYPGHNLHRARVQFRLLERMEAAGL